jgi:hypothetical protein
MESSLPKMSEPIRTNTQTTPDSSHVRDIVVLAVNQRTEMTEKSLPKLPDIELGRYKHYKGTPYELIGVGYHSETMEPICTYIDETGIIWSRPAEMWGEMVKVPRFQKLD